MTVQQLDSQTYLASIQGHCIIPWYCRTYAKGFGAVGALFAGSECVIEKTRAKHDIYNSMYAGCFAGGTLAASAGPKAACAGCLTFGAFSAIIDKFLEQP